MRHYRQLEHLARSLEREHPGAANSLREGLPETLTVQRLGIDGALARTLRTTNPIENMNGAVAHHTRNVQRWRDDQMLLRWIGSAPASALIPAFVGGGARRDSSRENVVYPLFNSFEGVIPPGQWN